MRICVVGAISIWTILELSCAADLSFDIPSATKTTYSKLLSDVRDKLKDAKLKYGGTDIPVIAATTIPVKYLLVDFKSSEGGTITFALRKNDSYLDAYLDKFQGKYRAHFFPNAPPTVKTLFPEAKGKLNRLDIKYKNTYADMENNAGIDRSNLGLGMDPLNKLVNKVYGHELDRKIEARLMLVVVEMVAEAARFYYLENMILKKFDTFYVPGQKMIKFSINWSTITKGIKNSKNGVISPALDLVDDAGHSWTVSSVNEIAGYMGLLKNDSKSLISLLYEMFINIIKPNNDDNEAGL